MSKVLIAVISCNNPVYASRLQAQKDTWIPQMQAAGWDVQIFDGSRLRVSDDYRHLPDKTKALCKWASENGYDHMLKLDDDAYVWIDRFKVYTGDYCGIRVGANDGGHGPLGIPNYPKGTFPYDYASGGSYWLSAKSLKIVADAPLTNDWAEDRWVGTVLAKAGVPLTPTPDYGCHTFVPVLHSNFAVLAQIPQGGIQRLIAGLEPGMGAHNPKAPSPASRQPVVAVPHRVVRPARGAQRGTRPLRPNIIRRPFGR